MSYYGFHWMTLGIIKEIAHMRRLGKTRLNIKSAKDIWGALSRSAVRSLKDLTEKHGLLVAAGDLQLLEGRWYITHAGLLRISELRRCSGIRTVVEKDLSDPSSGRWVFRATVYKTFRSKGFVGYGDATPSNVSSLVRGAEMRVAETRAVNRALRKAYGIGLCSIEELGWSPKTTDAGPRSHVSSPGVGNNGGRYNGHSRLRD
jgi:hypothetical protein